MKMVNEDISTYLTFISRQERKGGNFTFEFFVTQYLHKQKLKSVFGMHGTTLLWATEEFIQRSLFVEVLLWYKQDVTSYLEFSNTFVFFL